jgi:hypothetical protein
LTHFREILYQNEGIFFPFGDRRPARAGSERWRATPMASIQHVRARHTRAPVSALRNYANMEVFSPVLLHF